MSKVQRVQRVQRVRRVWMWLGALGQIPFGEYQLIPTMGPSTWRDHNRSTAKPVCDRSFVLGNAELHTDTAPWPSQTSYYPWQENLETLETLETNCRWYKTIPSHGPLVLTPSSLPFSCPANALRSPLQPHPLQKLPIELLVCPFWWVPWYISSVPNSIGTGANDPVNWTFFSVVCSERHLCDPLLCVFFLLFLLIFARSCLHRSSQALSLETKHDETWIAMGIIPGKWVDCRLVLHADHIEVAMLPSVKHVGTIDAHW